MPRPWKVNKANGCLAKSDWGYYSLSKCKSTLYWEMNYSAHNYVISLYIYSHDTDVTSSFGQQLSVCAGDVSHVLEVWLTHIFSPGGFAGQGGCHAHWAHGRGRCVAGVQGTKQEVCLLLAFALSTAHFYSYISVSCYSSWLVLTGSSSPIIMDL